MLFVLYLDLGTCTTRKHAYVSVYKMFAYIYLTLNIVPAPTSLLFTHSCSFNQLGADGVAALCQSLSSLARLQTLNLR